MSTVLVKGCGWSFRMPPAEIIQGSLEELFSYGDCHPPIKCRFQKTSKTEVLQLPSATKFENFENFNGLKIEKLNFLKKVNFLIFFANLLEYYGKILKL